MCFLEIRIQESHFPQDYYERPGTMDWEHFHFYATWLLCYMALHFLLLVYVSKTTLYRAPGHEDGSTGKDTWHWKPDLSLILM